METLSLMISPAKGGIVLDYTYGKPNPLDYGRLVLSRDKAEPEIFQTKEALATRITELLNTL